MPKKLDKKESPTTATSTADHGDFYSVSIGGETYKLSFDLQDLSEAETAFRQEGHRVNLLLALDFLSLDLTAARVIFAASARRFQPQLGYKGAVDLVTIGSLYTIATVIINAFADSKAAAFPAVETGATQRPVEE